MKKRTISAAIITLNESQNIARLIKSLFFCDEIIVMDTGSTDNTVSIAKQMGAKVKSIVFKGFSDAKNKAINACGGEYILSVDADEEITRELAGEIKRIVSSGSALDGYYIKRETFFLGRVIRHCGWGNDYQLRLFKRGKGAFDGKQVHESVMVNGPIGKIEAPMLHYSYPNSSLYFLKMNKYTGMQAEMKKRPVALLSLITAPALKFFRMYILKKGFLDGWQGFVLCAYSGMSEFVKFSKSIEHMEKAKREGPFALRAPNWLGDAVMSTALIKPLVKRHGEITIICGSGVKRVYEGHGGIKEIISFDKKNLLSYLEAISRIRKAGIRSCVNLSPSLSAGFMLFISGIGKRAGFDEDSLFMNIRVKRDRNHNCRHIIDEFAELCQSADALFPGAGLKQQLYVSAADNEYAGKLKRKRYIALAPFSAYGPAKMWPAAKWEELMDRISGQDKKAAFVLLGSRSDAGIVFRKRKELTDLRGKTGIGQAFAVIKGAAAFIGNDSGLMHVADAFNVPSAGIFASSSPLWTGMRSKNTAHIVSGEECSPCFDNKCRYGHYNCLKSITTEQALKTLLSVYRRQK